jgi:hypothetical protein
LKFEIKTFCGFLRKGLLEFIGEVGVFFGDLTK